MKAAIVREIGKTPVYGEFAEPTCGESEVQIAVTAAALSQLVRGRAAGTHYSTSGAVPFVVGVDGVGRLEDGRRVYFGLPAAPFGSMAEIAVVAASHCVAVPDGVDDVTAAAIANPGMSSWAALVERAKLVAGETVLVHGATGTAGRLAVQIAKYLGAKKVIATGRNPAALAGLRELGADVTVPLMEDLDQLESMLAAQFSEGIDVVLDYVWGESAERMLVAAAKAGRDGVPMRYVHIGGVSGSDIRLPGAVLRSSAVQLMGSGIGSVGFDRMIAAVAGVLGAVGPAGLAIETRSVPLQDVERVWPSTGNSPRVVFMV